MVIKMTIFKKVEVEKKNYIFPDSKIYFYYDMKLPEKMIWFCIGFAAGAVVGYIFLGLIIVSIIMGMIAGLGIIPIQQKKIIEKQINTLKKQFKDMLESVSTSIGAGRNIIDSFTNAHSDLKGQYSEDAYIVKETENIISGIHNNINIEKLLLDLADRSGIDDITTFADVFDTCYRKGGDIKEVIASTYKVINDKIEIEMEIRTMVTSAKAELNMMCAMPVVFILVLNSMGDNITGQGTTSGYIATITALIIFVAAYFIGKKIMIIKV